MASSSKANLLGKRKPEDDLETEPVLRRHKSEEKETTEGFADSQLELLETKSDEAALNSAKDTVEGLDEDPDFVEEFAGPNKTLFLDKLSSDTEISEIIDFFQDVGQVVGVRLKLNHKGGHVDSRVGRRVDRRVGCGFVEFASSNEAKKALKKKNGEYWLLRKVFLKEAATFHPRKYYIDHNVWYEDYLQREGLLIEEYDSVDGLDETPDSTQEAAIPKKTLFVGGFSPQTKPRDIIHFFKDVGGVSYVRLIGDHTGKHVGYGFVEFASVDDTNKALEQKNGEYLEDCKISLEVANKGAKYLPPPKYCLYYKVWFEESLPSEGLDATPDLAEATAVPKKTLFISHLSHQTTIISDIINFFKDVGEVVRVRLVVDQRGEHGGCGFVEFASSDEANKALQQKNGEYLHNCSIFLDVANKEFSENFPPKYCMDHKVWYKEDFLQRESLLIEEDKTLPDFAENVLLVANLSPQTTKISHIIKFFKYVGKVVSVRLIVNRECKHVGYGLIEFASPFEAKEALKMMNGAYMHDHKILLMKGIDQTPDFVEAIATSRSKTLYVANLPREKTEISHIIDFFEDVGKVVHVRLICNLMGKHVGTGFVEFASAGEAKKALEKKNGEYFHRRKIFLDIAEKARAQSKYCIDHNVWYEDYLQQESLSIGVPDFAEENAVGKKTLFVANLSHDNNEVQIPNICKIFKDVGGIVRVRLIVDHWGGHVSCAFVEFASTNEVKTAKKMLRHKKNCTLIYHGAEIAVTYPFRPRYNLAEKLWYEDMLRREYLKTNPNLKITTFTDDKC